MKRVFDYCAINSRVSISSKINKRQNCNTILMKPIYWLKYSFYTRELRRKNWFWRLSICEKDKVWMWIKQIQVRIAVWKYFVHQIAANIEENESKKIKNRLMTTHVIVIICRYYRALFWIALCEHEYTEPFSAARIFSQLNAMNEFIRWFYNIKLKKYDFFTQKK